MSLQLAAASYIYICYDLKKKRKEWRWWQRQLYTSREVYGGSSLLADLNFQSVSGLYSKTCLKRTLKGPENFSAKGSFRLIKVHYIQYKKLNQDMHY